MSENREELIRARAHAIWEAEGSPEGRADQHWEQATLEIEQASTEVDTQAARAAPKEAAATKAAPKPAVGAAAKPAPKRRTKAD